MSTSRELRRTPFRVAFAAWLAFALGFFDFLSLPILNQCQRMVDKNKSGVMSLE